jgi:hypothetical protein
MTGTVVYEVANRSGNIIWDLNNNAGRKVANGSYLVIARIEDVNGKIYMYSAKLGVKR